MIERYSQRIEESALKLSGSQIETQMHHSIQKESWRQYDNNQCQVIGKYVPPESMAEWDFSPLERHSGYEMARLELSRRPSLIHLRTGVDRSAVQREKVACDVNAMAARHDEWLDGAHVFVKEIAQRFRGIQFSHKLSYKQIVTHYQNDLGRHLRSVIQQEYYELLWHLPESKKLFDGAFELQPVEVDFASRLHDMSCLVESSMKTVGFQNSGVIDVVIMTDEYEFQKTFMTDLHLKHAQRSGKRIGCTFHPDFQIFFSRNEQSSLCFFDETGGFIKNGDDRILLVSNGCQHRHYSDYRTSIEMGDPQLETSATWAAYDGFPTIGYFPVQLESNTPLNTGDLFKGDVLFIVNVGGTQVSETGEWTVPIQLAYWMVDGRWMGRVEPMTCVANYHHMLNDDFGGIGTLPFKEKTRTGIRTKMRIQNL